MPVDLLSEYAIEEQPVAQTDARRPIDLFSDYAVEEEGPELAYPAGLEEALPTDRFVTEAPSASLGDIIRRLPAGVAESGAQAGAGILKGTRDIISTIPSADTSGPMFRPEDPNGKLKQATEFMREVSERSRADYGVDPTRDQAFLSQVASSAGSVVPAFASGPFAPLTIAGMMGESGRAEAEQAGGTPEQQDKAFYANAAVGAVSEALLGVPALLRSVRAARIPERTFQAMAKSAAFEALKGGLREGTQEAIEQTATNLIAKYIAEYDPDRPELQGAWRSFLVGSVTGAPVAGAVQTAENLAAPVPAAPESEAEMIMTPDLQAGVVRAEDGRPFEITETGISEIVPGSPKDISMSVLGTREAPTEGGEPSATEEITQPESIPAQPEGGTPGREATEAGVSDRPVGATPSRQEAAPETVKLSPFEPQTEGNQIISTGILGEDGKPLVGQQWNSPHAEIIKQNPELALIDDIENRKGFIIQDAEGNQRFVGRKQALEVGQKAGQVDLEKVYDPEGHGLISEALLEIKPATEPTPTEPAAQVTEDAPPGPPPAEPQGIPEDRGRPPLPTPTGPRNAVTEANRFLQGLGPRAEPLRRTAPEVMARAMEMIEREPALGSRLIKEINNEARVLLPEETAVLAREQVTRENEYNAALDAVNSAPNEAVRRDAENRLTAARDANQEAYSAMERSGTPTGQALAFRKFMVNRDYTLARMEAEVRALKGGEPLAPKDLAEVKALHERIKVAEDRARAAEEQLARRHGQTEFQKLLKIARQEGLTARREGKSILDRIISNGDSALERIRKRARSGRSMMSMTVIDPVDFVDYAQVGAGYLARGVRGLADFTKRLVGDFGKDIEPHSERIYGAANQLHQEATSTIPKVRTVAEAAAMDRADAPLDPQVVYDIARAHVNAGMDGFERVMEATARTVQANHPEVTVRQVRDAFSGYGKVTRPSQAADRIKLREYRRLGQLASAIEDAQRRIAPMKSGAQRDKATEAIRSKMAELKRVMAENGIDVTSPEQQLATAERTAITRLQNTAESLERQIANNTRDAKAEGKRPDTPEIRALQERVDSLRETLDEVAPRTAETESQKLERSIAATEKRIADLDAQLRTGQIGRTRTTTGPTSPKLERLRSERDAMVKLVRELRETQAGKPPPAERKIQAALKAVDRQVAELDRQLRTGDVQVKPRERQASSPTLDARRAERDAMVALRNDLRSLAKPRLTPDQRAIRAVRKSIAELDRQIREGSVEPRNVPRGTPSPELEALRAERDAMRKLIGELRKEGKPSRSPEEVALARYKASLATRTKAIEDRIKANDYVPRVRKETVLDADALTARFEYQKAKDAYEQKVFEYDMARRTAMKRAYDTALEVLNTSRSIMTSIDYSAPLRQGAFITLAHPIRSLKLFPKMFSASGLSPGAAREGLRAVFETGNPLKYFKAAGEHGEKMAYAIQESLSDPAQRPNAINYRQWGLDLTETGPNTSRRKLEEAYQSRFASKIPIVAGSQRAYTAFLNLLRADSMDAMVKTLGKGGKVTDLEGKAIANFINIATGRGKYGQKMEQATQFLNSIFFAPKYVTSRFQLIAGQPFYGGNARTRVAIAKEYGRFLLGAGIVLGLARLGGAEVEDDPRSSDFGKIKIGNTRLDPMGGLAQVTTLLARGITGETKEVQTGRIKELKPRERLSLIGKFARQKFSPIVSANVDAFTGEDVVGQPVTKIGAYSRLVVPLQFGDVIEAMVEQGIPRGMAVSLVSIFGASMSTYDAGARKPKEARQPWETLAEDYQSILENPMQGQR